MKLGGVRQLGPIGQHVGSCRNVIWVKESASAWEYVQTTGWLLINLILLKIQAQMRLTQDQVDSINRRINRPGSPVLREKKPSKHRSKKTIINGMVFDSAHEARRYAELHLMQKAGQIRNLQRQVPYDMIVNGQHICTYIADAVYEHAPFGKRLWIKVVEDSKSPHTRKLRDYRIKVKLLHALHGIAIQEVL